MAHSIDSIVVFLPSQIRPRRRLFRFLLPLIILGLTGHRVFAAPTFTSPTTAGVNEGVSAGTVVYTAVATDPGFTVTYSLSGPDAPYFTINASTGQVTINSVPEYAVKSSYSFNVVATDGGPAPSTLPVTLYVNDVAPVFSSSTTASVNEGVPAGTVVYTAVATDPGYPGGVVTYALSGPDASYFTVNSSTGVVTINSVPEYAFRPSYSFNVIATDGGPAYGTLAVTLNVNDVPPFFTSSTTASVNEGVPGGTTVYTAVAADPGGGPLAYFLSGPDASFFSINPSTGVVTINSVPEYAFKSSYSFTVMVTDGGPTASISVTLTVNDVPPGLAPSTTNAFVNEGVSPGTTVYTAVATDPGGGPVTYFLSGPDAAAFTVTTSGASGAVVINSVPEYAAKSSYSFTVTATDGGAGGGATFVTLFVNDVAPVFSSSTTASVNEGVPAGTVVYSAVATDPAGGPVTYLLSGPDAAAFTINPSTGQVAINSVPEYEAKSSYNFTVAATDGGPAYGNLAVRLNVNDVPPVFSSSTTASVNEGVPAGTTVYTAVATDPGPLTYFLSGPDGPYFTINSSTGVVTINSVPEYAVKSSYSFIVVATDDGGLQYSTIGVTLTVKQVVIPTPPALTGANFSGNAGFAFQFTNVSGASFTALASTNVTLPLSNWTVLGAITDNPPGVYHFSDPQATNNPLRFYRVRSP